MQLRDDKPEIFAPGVWAIPGGKREEGEEPSDAIVREFSEETDYICKPKFFRNYVYDFIENNPLTAFYYDYYDGKSLINCHEGQQMKFLTISEIEEKPLFPVHNKVIKELFEHLKK